MRTHVIAELINKATEDERICLLVGDLGFSVVEGFRDRFPDRFINCGIAEQNMMSVAAGLALEGDKVFVYSIGNFPTLRCLEQIRNDVCYHNLDVNIISVGGGFAYGAMGMSHHTTEDLAIMRSLANMNVYAPADYHEALSVLDEVYSAQSPSYMRLSKGTDKVFHQERDWIDIKNLIPYEEYYENKYEVTIISAGTLLEEAISAKHELRNMGISARIYSCPTIKPIDREGVYTLANTSTYLVTCEEHNSQGGLGGAVSEILSEMNNHASLIRIGLDNEYSEIVGSTEYLRKRYGLDGKSIADKIIMRMNSE